MSQMCCKDLISSYGESRPSKDSDLLYVTLFRSNVVIQGATPINYCPWCGKYVGRSNLFKRIVAYIKR